MNYKKLENMPRTTETLINAYNNGTRPYLMQKIQWIHDLVKHYKGNSFNEKLYNVFYPNIINECKNCKKETKFYHKEFNRGYAEFCSCSCRAIYNKCHLNGYKDEETIIKRNASIKKSLNARNSEEIKNFVNKIHETKQIKFGKNYTKIIGQKTKQSILGDDVYNKLYSNTEYLIKEYVHNKKSMLSISKQLSISDGAVKTALLYHNIPINKNKSVSYLETQIKKWLIDNNISFVCNDKTIITPYEIDFYCDEYNVAIEICGLYYHSVDNVHVSNQRRDKNYHQKKFLECKEKNIKLITIFEDEIISKWDLIQMRLRHLFKLNKNEKIYARKCIIKDVSRFDAKIFFKKYHMQSSKTGQINKGLFYDGNLVACASLGKPRYTNNYDYELLRYCTKNCAVIGGLSKLLSKIYGNIITYSCNRWGDGNGYINSGFNIKNITKPSYFYFKPSNPKIKYHRSQFMKHKLQTTLTERQEMKKRGYMRIYDCGVTVWERLNYRYIQNDK